MHLRRLLIGAVAALAVAGLAVVARAGEDRVETSATSGSRLAAVAVLSPSTTPPTSATSTTAPAAPTVATTATTAISARRGGTPGFVPFGVAGPVTLFHPAARIERVAFHQSNHEGARQQEARPGAHQPTVLESRERLTGGQSAADVVVEPGTEIRSPVTGRVKRAGTYTLYCKHRDDYVVVAPDEQPAWEVKVLHIDGVTVKPGQRVTAGVTRIAPRATQLPFESQVDELRTGEPAWPHVHIEVVDPAIRNRPSPGSSC